MKEVELMTFSYLKRELGKKRGEEKASFCVMCICF